MSANRKEQLRTVLSKYQFIYLLFFSLTIIWEYIPVRAAIPAVINVYNVVLLGSGALFLLGELFVNWKNYLNLSGILRALFLISTVISCLLMRRYGLSDNFRAVSWLCVELFLFLSVDSSVPHETLEKRFHIVSQTVILLSTAGVAVSLWQFLVHYQTVYFFEGSPPRRQGFMSSRLFGIFEDPNYMAVFCLAVITLAIIQILWQKKKPLVAAYHLIVIVIQYSYIILSGSRTAILGLFVMAILLGFFWPYRILFRNRKMWQRTVLSAVTAAVIAGAVFAGNAGTKAVYSWLYRQDFGHTAVQQQSPEAEAQQTQAVQVQEQTDILARGDVTGGFSTGGRTNIWKDFIQVYKTVPVFGTSPRNTQKYAEENMGDLMVVRKGFGVHNTFLALFVRTGTVGGCIAFAWLGLIVFQVLRFLVTQRPEGKVYYTIMLLTGFMAAAAIAAFSLECIFFKDAKNDFAFWITMGFMLAFIRQAEAKAQKQEISADAGENLQNQGS